MNLPEEDPELFDIFIQCLYAGETPLPSLGVPQHHLLQLFILADKYEVRALKSGIIDRYFASAKKHEKAPGTALLSEAYAQTRPSCGLRRLFVDWYCWQLHVTRKSNTQTVTHWKLCHEERESYFGTDALCFHNMLKMIEHIPGHLENGTLTSGVSS